MRSPVEISMKSCKRAVIAEITCATAMVGENQVNGLSELIVFFVGNFCSVKRCSIIVI